MIVPFDPPKVERGQLVAWYKSGVKDDRIPDLAFVKADEGRTLLLVLISGKNRGYEMSVRHVDDPKLKDSADFRAEGAWDFTAFDVRRREFEDGLERRVKSLELQFGRKEHRDNKLERATA